VRTIAQLSDLHFGRHDPVVVNALLSSLKQCVPDLVVVSGDFTQRARQSEFIAARAFLDRIAAPKLIVPGNHDVPLFGLHRRIFTPFAKFNRYLRPAGVTGAYFGDGEIAVLGINTARRFTGKNGRVSFEQMAQMKSTFAQLPSEVLKIVVTHHPIGSPQDLGSIDLAWRSDDACRAIISSGVNLLLSGHYHHAASGAVAVETLRGSVLVVHAGTATSNRLRGGEGNTFNLIALHEQVLTVSIMQYVARRGFSTAVKASYRLLGGYWQPEAREDLGAQESSVRERRSAKRT
jgi:3',5'-cyclic AMP phosphodiesterase CpdA